MDDRSERLRRRRNRSTERDQPEDSEPSKPSKPPEQSESDGREERSDDDTGPTGADGDIPIKEEQTGTYMYLPETQTKEMKRLYNVLKAEYEFEYDEEFEKNRHFYPLVVEYGLDSLDGMDAFEVREKLEEFYE